MCKGPYVHTAQQFGSSGQGQSKQEAQVNPWGEGHRYPWMLALREGPELQVVRTIQGEAGIPEGGVRALGCCKGPMPVWKPQRASQEPCWCSGSLAEAEGSMTSPLHSWHSSPCRNHLRKAGARAEFRECCTSNVCVEKEGRKG